MAALSIRPVAGDADLAAYVGTWNALTPDQQTTIEAQSERRERNPSRLYLLAELDAAVVAAGFAGPSDSPGRAHVAPKVLPHARRRGVGSALLERLVAHAEQLGSSHASSHVDGDDAGSLEFARRHGFEEVDRQVEQVLELGQVPAPEVPDGITFVTIAERPELLREAYDLGLEGWSDMALSAPATISLDDWLREEATLPEGSFVALAGDEIVGFSGLCSSRGGTAEDGLTVVRRAWRGRGLATALKQAELAWAAQNGIHEVVTWTQRGNDAMRVVNERLGYVYRGVTVTVRRTLP